MKKFHQKYGPWALVAGDGEGLGAAFCQSLDEKGFNLILVDIKTDSMVELSQNLESQFNTSCITVPLDLNTNDALDQLSDIIKNKDCKLLIYNAAYGPVKPFLENTPAELDDYLNVNARTPLQLIYGFVQHLTQSNKNGGIILMSSLAGLFGTQLLAPYTATKAFDYNLAEALFHELKPHRIDVLACCAGAIDTPNYRSTKPNYGWIKPSIMKPRAVAERTLKKLGKKGFFIPGFRNWLNFVLLSRILPRSLAARLFNNAVKRMYRGRG